MTNIVEMPTLCFKYKNHRDAVEWRRIEVPVFFYGNTPWHPDVQWMLRGYDLDRNSFRDFAVKNILEFKS